MVFAVPMKKIAATAALSCALLAVPAATASAAPASSGSGTGTGSSETQLICSPVAQLLFATGSVEKPALYDLLCLFS